jgi:succinyl-diaminopimelate desuccinylase
LKDSGIKLNKRVRLILGTDEETKWRGVNHYFKVQEMPTVGFSPDAEFPVIYGEKGIMSIDVTSKEKSNLEFKAGVRYNVVPDTATCKTNINLAKEYNQYLKDHNLEGEYTDIITMYGKNAHAMEPKNGVNAAIKLCQFLSKHIDNKLIDFVNDKLVDSRFKDMNLAFSDKEMKDLTVNVAIINIDQNNGKLGLNLRYPINWNKEEFLVNFKKQASEYGLDIEVVSDQIPHYVDRNDPLIRTLHNAYIEYTHDTKTPLMTIGGGTYGRALKKGVAFGAILPGREDVAHQVDEYIILDDIMVATAIYAKAIYDLGK